MSPRLNDLGRSEASPDVGKGDDGNWTVLWLGMIKTGTNGDDRLTGEFSDDILIGLLGNDRYYVYNEDVQVVEAAGGGTDTVYATLSYSLAAGEEVETLRAYTGSAGLTLTGNELENNLFGGDGAKTWAGTRPCGAD